MKVGRDVKYALSKSSSILDRKMAAKMIEMGLDPVRSGTVTYVGDTYVLVRIRSRTGSVQVPIEAIL